jgi:hypothetical protein
MQMQIVGRNIPTSRIGETPAYPHSFNVEYQNPEHATTRKRELVKHLFLILGANLTNLGITNLGVILAGKNKDLFPANAPKEMVFYALIMLIHFMFLTMVFYAMVDHSLLIRETGSTNEMMIFTTGFVLSSTIIFGFIELHCSMICLVFGFLAIYYLFIPYEYPFALWFLTFVVAVFLIFFVPTIITSTFGVKKEAAGGKEL